MKKSFFGKAIVVLLSFPSLVSCASKGNFLKEHQISLDKYTKLALETNQVYENLTWKSSDTSIATVDEYGIVDMCGKLGKVTIICSDGKAEDKCEITAISKSKKGHINETPQVTFYGVAVTPTITLEYDSFEFELKDFTLKSNDTSIVRIDNKNQLFGVSIGTTTVDVEGVWKGMTLASKTFDVEVKETNTILLDKNEYDIYAVDNSSISKENRIEVTGTTYSAGKVIDDTYNVSLDSNDYISSSGNIVSFKQMYSGVDAIQINGRVSSSVINGVSAPIKINVHSNFEKKEDSFEIKESNDSNRYKIELTNNISYGGKDNVTKYEIPNIEINQNKNNKAWSTWSTRVEFYETTNKNGVNSYSTLMEKGYAVIGFDLCYTGTKGLGIGAYNNYEYFYVDSEIRNPSIFVVNSDNKATNLIKSNQWFRVYININTLLVENASRGATNSSIFLNPCFAGDITYVGNIGYYFDNSILNSFQKAYDDRDRTIVTDPNNNMKGCVNDNEFLIYSPTYVSCEKNADVYVYDSSNAQTTDIELRSKIFPYNCFNGYACAEGYRYFSFKFKYLSGTPILYLYDLYKESNVVINLVPGTEINYENLYLFHQGYRTNEIINGEEMEIVLKIDGKAADSMYITSKVKTLFEISNFAYFKDDSFKIEFGYNQHLNNISSNIDSAFVGDSFNLLDYFDVFYKNKLIFDYSVNNVEIDQPSLVNYDSATHTIIPTGTGTSHITATFGYNGLSTTGTITLRSYESNFIVFNDKQAEVYCGNLDLGNKSYQVNLTTYKNRQKIKTLAGISFSVESGSDLIKVENGIVTGLKAGDAVLKAFFILDGKEYSDTMNIKVYNESMNASLKQITKTNLELTKESQPFLGVENVYKLSSSKADWGDAVDIETVAHDNTSTAISNIKKYGIKYFVFNMYCLDSTYFRIYAPAKDGTHKGDNVNVGYSIEKVNDNIAFYQNGISVNKIMMNTWYTVVVDYTNFSRDYVSGYPCVHFTNMKGNAYIGNVRWYNVSSFIDMPFKSIEIGDHESKSLGATYFENGVPKAHKFSIDNNEFVKLENNTLSGIKVGDFDTKIYSEDKFTNVPVHISVVSSRISHDGSELILTTKTHTFSYELCEEDVGGKTGVYKYTGQSGCNYLDTLEVKETAHKTPNTGKDAKVKIFETKKEAILNLINKGIKYVSANIYVTSGTTLRIWAMKKQMNGNDNVTIQSDGLIEYNNLSDVVSFYKEDGTKLTDSIPNNTWINVVVDYSFLTSNADQYVYIQFSNGVGTYYINDISYYTSDYKPYLKIR